MLIVLFTTVDFLLPLIVRSVGAFDVAAIFRLLRMFRAIRALRALRVLRTIRYDKCFVEAVCHCSRFAHAVEATDFNLVKN